MSQQFRKKLIIGSILSVIAIILLIVWYVSYRNSPTPITNSNTSTTHLQISDTCDCLIVTESAVVSPITKGATKRYSDSSFEVPENVFYGQWMSPSRTMELGSDTSQSSLLLARYPSGKVTKLYNTPSGEVVNGWAWSPDETFVILGLATTVSGTSPSELMPSQILRVDVETGAVSTIVSEIDFQHNQLNGAIPVAVNRDATRIVLHTGTNIGDITYWAFVKKTGVISTLDPQPMVGIYFSQAYSDMKDKLLWVDVGNKLNSYSVDDGSFNKYSEQAWSDAPFSRPSPDGKKILYLRGEQSGDFGIPALLDLVTGTSRDVTTQKMGLPGGLARSFWSPDSTWVFFQNPDVSEQAYQAFRVSSAGIEEKLVDLGFVVDIGHTSISALVNANSD